MTPSLSHFAVASAVAVALSAAPAMAQKKYDSGASDTEIKIGQTVPFSGPASAYATIGKAFIPIPVFRWSWGGRLDQTLLDLQSPLLDAIASRAPASSRMMIASGDVAILSPPPDHVPDADVIIAGLWTTPEAASRWTS